MKNSSLKNDHFDFFTRVLIVIGIVAAPVLVWYLFGVVLMAFGAIILAMLLHLGARPLVRWLCLPEWAALTLSGLIILGIVLGTAYLFGTQITGQFQDVMQRTTSASAGIEKSLQGTAFGRYLLQHMSSNNLSVADVLPGLVKVSTNLIEGIIIMIICGAYMAAQPDVYRKGLIWMFPPRHHARAAEIFDGIAEALRLWLLGQLIEMFVIGVLCTLAVWMIGVPSPFALGLIAAIGEFIPYLGPILAGIPAVLVAFTQNPTMALWTALAYLLIHQIEGNLVAPLIQRRMVAIPPAVMLLGIAAISYLFGAVAIIFAAPIAVVIFAAVNLIYVRDTLGEKTELTKKLS